MANGKVFWDPSDILRIPPTNHRRCMASASCSGSLDPADSGAINTKLTEMSLLNPFTTIQEPWEFHRLATALLCKDHQQNKGAEALGKRWQRAIEDRYSWTFALDEEVLDECPIGLDKLKIGDQVMRCKACEKCIHGRCIKDFVKRKGTCPCWYVFLTIGMVYISLMVED